MRWQITWNLRLRQIHRWISIAFTVGVIINTVVAMRGAEPAAWVYFLAGGPLLLLLITGLYLFVLPYTAKHRAKGRASV
jgi:hypothetical protein|nr:hypothetical protein [Nitratireductor sp. B36]